MIFSTNLEHVILSRVMTLEIKVFEKNEVYDGLYNCLLCIVIVNFCKVHNIFNRIFFTTKLNGGVQKG
jgi:hypothetical protein